METIADFLCVATILCLIYYLFVYENNIREGLKKTCNNIDEYCYDTIETFEDHRKASELLAHVNGFIIDFIKKLKHKYIILRKGSEEMREVIQNLVERYRPDFLKENLPEGDSTENTSYIEDKKIMGICLRERKSGTFKFHDLELVKFVVIHELAHLGNPNFGHKKDFWMIFKTLLKDAHEFGIYIPVDYRKNPDNYCLLDINYNPYFDSKIQKI